MKLVTYKKLDGRLSVGTLRDDVLYSLSGQSSMQAIIAEGIMPDADDSFKVMKHHGIQVPLIPSKILCIGRNYAEHAAEMNNAVPEKPLVFAKFPSSVIANGEPIRWHKDFSQQVDWEGELGVIIGKTARNISEEHAYDHIFGYTITNDVSARDIQSAESQWVRAKGADTFCPLGSVIVTKDEIPDPHNLQLQTRVNGDLMQDGHTRDMIFSIPYLVAYLSRTLTLLPGDLIMTGTPSGVGKGMNPPRFLQDGDEVSVSIEGLGTLSNPCQVVG